MHTREIVIAHMINGEVDLEYVSQVLLAGQITRTSVSPGPAHIGQVVSPSVPPMSPQSAEFLADDDPRDAQPRHVYSMKRSVVDAESSAKTTLKTVIMRNMTLTMIKIVVILI